MADIRINSRQVTIQCDHASPIVYNHYPRHTKWLAVIQILGGVVLLIVGFASIHYGPIMGALCGSQGFGITVPAILTGSFGIAAARSKAICQITTNLIFSILTAIGSCVVAVSLIQALILVSHLEANPFSFGAMKGTEGRWQCLVVLAIAIIEAVVSIVQASIACHFSCFCCKKCCCNFDTTTTEQIIVSNAQQEQQILLLGSCAPGAEMQPMAPIYNGPSQQTTHEPPQYSKYDV